MSNEPTDTEPTHDEFTLDPDEVEFGLPRGDGLEPAAPKQ